MNLSYLATADSLLRGHAWATQTRRALWRLLLVLVFFGITYGAVMGCFGGFSGDRLWQILYSAAKVPLLLIATFLIGLPSFFVLNTLLGLRSDFSQAVRALIATQAGLAIILASLAPLTACWYLSSTDYDAAILFNAAMFGIASLSAQFVLRRYYQPLIERNPHHRKLMIAWVGIYAFVGIQMGWILRPFVGYPNAPVQFFRDDTWGNAYVIVFQTIWRTLFG